MSTLDTVVPSIDLGTGEVATYGIDVTDYLGSGESLQTSPGPTIAITSVANNSVVSGAITSGPSVSGNQVVFTITGSFLQPKQSYSLIATFNTTATKKLQTHLNINVPF